MRNGGYSYRKQKISVISGAYRSVTLRHKRIEHSFVRVKLTACPHREKSGRTARNQRNTVLVHCDRLLSFSALNIPENYLGERISFFGILSPCSFEVRFA